MPSNCTLPREHEDKNKILEENSQILEKKRSTAMEVYKCLASDDEMYSSAMRPSPVKELGTCTINGTEVSWDGNSRGLQLLDTRLFPDFRWILSSFSICVF